jgi:hypothetical protein
MRRVDTHHKRRQPAPLCAGQNRPARWANPFASSRVPATHAVLLDISPTLVEATRVAHDLTPPATFAPLPVGYRSPVPGCRSAVPMLSEPGRRPYRGLG